MHVTSFFNENQNINYAKLNLFKAKFRIHITADCKESDAKDRRVVLFNTRTNTKNSEVLYTAHSRC